MVSSWLRSQFSKTVLTVSIETGTVRMMTAEGRKVGTWLEAPLDPNLVTDGRIDDIPAVAAVMKEAADTLGVTPGKVVAAFPSPRITARIMSFPAIRGIRPDQVVPREARRIMGPAVDYHYLFWSPLGRTGLEERYYLVAAPKAELIGFFQALAASGLRPKWVDSRALALVRAVGVDSSLIVNVEPSSLDVVVAVDYVPQVLGHRELQPDTDVEGLLEEVVDELQGSIEFHGDRNPNAPLPEDTPVYLMGGHPYLMEPQFTEPLGNTLAYELFLSDPGMEYPEDFPVEEFMINVGLALKLA